MRIVPIPAWVMLGAWFALQLVNGIATDTTAGGVAHWAHAGGFIVGFVLIIPLWLRLGGRAWWTRTHYHPPHPRATYPSRIPVVRRR
jgi:membrane associated rhomboid family serine protease